MEQKINWFSWWPGYMRPMNGEVAPFLKEPHPTDNKKSRAPSKVYHRRVQDEIMPARLSGVSLLDSDVVDKNMKTTVNSIQ